MIMFQICDELELSPREIDDAKSSEFPYYPDCWWYTLLSGAKAATRALLGMA